MPELIFTVRRFSGKFLIAYLTESETGRQVVTVPCDFWRKGRRREVGGHPFPRPNFGTGRIAEFAGALVEARLTGCEPPTVKHDMTVADVAAAVHLAEEALFPALRQN